MMRYTKTWVVILGFLLTACASTWAQDPGWPRQITKQGGTLVYYQPQVDDWKEFSDLTWRLPITLTPPGGKQVVGVLEMEGHTDVDNDNKLVLISNLKVTGTHFPSLEPATSAQMDQLARTFVPPTVTISLHRLVAVVKKAEAVQSVPVKNDPPAIV